MNEAPRSWAVVPLPSGDPLPLGLRVVGPSYTERQQATRRAEQLERLGAGRWPVDFLVVGLSMHNEIVAFYPENPSRHWTEPARRWARESLERLPSEVEKPDAVGALLEESGLSRAQIRKLRRSGPPDPARSRAARRSAARRHEVAQAVAEAGGEALPAPLAAAARKASYERTKEGVALPVAVAHSLRQAAALEAHALELGRVDPEAAAATLRRRASEEDDPAQRALIAGAAELAAVAPDVVPCASPPGEVAMMPGAEGAAIPVILGASLEIVIPSQAGGLRSLPAQYALIDGLWLQVSHDPNTFRPNAIYPSRLQERDYQRDQGEQLKVRQAEARFVPSLVINTATDAASGPPIVDQGPPWVLGGNSRAMVILRVLGRGPDNAYTAALIRILGGCANYGLSPDQVKGPLLGVGDPLYAPGRGRRGSVLVRVLRGEYDSVSISRDLNLGFTMIAGAAARAVSVGRLLPARLFELLAAELLDGESTLSQAISRRGPEIVNLLRSADVITPQVAPLWLTSRDGRLSSGLSREGRQLLRDALLGRLIDDKEALSLSSPRLEDLYERAAPALLALETSVNNANA